MKIKTVTTDRYPASRKHFILNLVISLWFTKEKEKIVALGDSKRTALWEKMDPYSMLVEPPVIFKDTNFIACLIDRPAGVLLPDRSIPLITFQDFLDNSLESDNIKKDGDYNTDLADEVKNGVTLTDLYAIIHQPDTLSTDPIFYLAKIDGSDEYVILYDNKTTEPDFDSMVSWIFRDYDFEQIDMSVYESTDSEVEKLNPTTSDVTSFYTGTVTVQDKALKEKSITFNFIDLKLLAEVIENIESVIIVNVDEPAVTDIADTTVTEQTVGTGTVVTTSGEVNQDQLVLSTVKDDQGNDISADTTLVISTTDKKKFDASLKLSNFPYEFCFLNSKGYRRSVTAEIKIKDSTEPGMTIECPINYELKENGYIPKLVSITPTDKTSSDKPVFTMGIELVEITDTGSTVLGNILPHTLGENFELFDTANDASFVGPDVTIDGTTLLFDIVFNNYGDMQLGFTDPAVDSVVISNAVDPSKHYAFAKQTVDYDGSNLNVLYYVYGPEGVGIDLTGSRFSEDALPLINGVKPTVQIDGTSCVLSWMVGTVDQTSTAVEGTFLLGSNSVNVHYNDNLEYGGAKKEVGIDSLKFTNPSVITDLTTSTPAVATDMAITTTDLVNSSKIVLTNVKDRLGETVTGAKLVIPEGENFEFNGEVDLSDYPYEFAFKHEDGSRRKLTGTVGIEDSTLATKDVEILIDYKLSPKGMTPTIVHAEYHEDTNSKDNITLQLDMHATTTTYVKDKLEDGYNLFADDSNNQLTVIDSAITPVQSEAGYPVLQLVVSAAKYGNFDAEFKDSAVANLKGSFADPELTYVLKRTGLEFADKILTLTYQLTDSDGNNIELYNGTFGESVPQLDLDDTSIDGNYVWDNGKLTLEFNGVTTDKVPQLEIESEFFIGSNKLAISYVESYTPPAEGNVKISDFTLYGGQVSAQPGQTSYTFGVGSSITLDTENEASVSDLKLVKFIDGLGDDITDKVTANFTETDDKGTQFTVDFTVDDYALPLSFDNGGNSGKITVTLSVQGNESTASGKYQAIWQEASIVPKLESIVKTDSGWDVSLSFKDTSGRAFTTAVQQTITNFYNLLDSSGSNAATYAGGGVTFTNNTSADTNQAIAKISVTIPAYGDFTLTFEESAFKAVSGSIVDPSASYALTYYDDGVNSVNNEKYVRFELYKDGEKATVTNGSSVNSSLKATRNGEDILLTIGWTYANVDAAILKLTMHDKEATTPADFVISGNFYIGSNLVAVPVSWEGSIPAASASV